jgi:hypothetical protein
MDIWRFDTWRCALLGLRRQSGVAINLRDVNNSARRRFSLNGPQSIVLRNAIGDIKELNHIPLLFHL